MSEDTPELTDVLKAALRSAAEQLHVAIPARVESYDADTQSVSVQPLIKKGHANEEGAREAETLPIVNKVPVVFPGAGGFRVTFPVVAGDTVLLVFSEASIDIWLSEGGLVDPRDDRLHTLSDAIAIPGLRDFKRALADAPTDRMSVGGDDGGASVEIHPTEVRLGDNTASDYVALQSEVKAIRDTLNNHTHTTTATVSTGSPGTVSNGPAVPDPAGSTKVKAI